MDNWIAKLIEWLTGRTVIVLSKDDAAVVFTDEGMEILVPKSKQEDDPISVPQHHAGTVALLYSDMEEAVACRGILRELWNRLGTEEQGE